MLNKKGMQFFWIFTLIAGVVILFMFANFAIKYKDLEVKKTDIEIVNNLNNAFQRLQGDQKISVNLNFPKETEIRCGKIILGESYSVNSIIFSKERVKDDVVVWQEPLNYPFKVATLYYAVDKDEKFNIDNEIIDNVPDSIRDNFNSLEGRKVVFSKIGTYDVFVSEEEKYVEFYEEKYTYYTDEMLLGILISDNPECLINEINLKIKELSKIYFNKVSLLKDCDYSLALEILNDMGELKDLEDNKELLERENKNLIGRGCVGIY